MFWFFGFGRGVDCVSVCNLISNFKTFTVPSCCLGWNVLMESLVLGLGRSVKAAKNVKGESTFLSFVMLHNVYSTLT